MNVPLAALAALTVSALAAVLPVTAAAAAPAPVPAAAVAASGNFHTPDNAVACHWITYRPISAALAASVKIHCERLADKTFVTLQTNGTITTSHSGTAVARGTASHGNGWLHRYTAKTVCIAELIYGKPGVTCTRSGNGSFAISAGGLNVHPG
ncbi:MAG TPA: hypothetical protein VFQ71_05590 [Gaiellales bacterium]|jgi:hypothetical protein|nr:hypothetical protein [Gaiellales bacterium]